MWVTLPKLLLWVTGSTSKDIQLQITLPRTTQGDSPKAVPLWSLMPISSSHSVTECSSEVVTGPSLTKEIADLLSNPMLKMPGNPPLAIPPIQWPRRETPSPGEALQGYLKQPPPSPHGSSQADMANIMAPSSHSPSPGTLERGTSPTPLADSINLLVGVLHLQEEMNDVMVHLLSARAAMDMHHQQVLLETEVSHCQNEINTSEAIREIKAWYTTMVRDAEVAYRTPIREVEAIHLASTSTAEIIQATGIRKAQAANGA